VFQAAGQALALPLLTVVEVVPFRPPTPVPWIDRAVLGLLPLRGRMVTLVDLRSRLGLPPRPPGGRAQVIIVETPGGLVGLVVDAVTRVGGARTEAPRPAPAALGLARPGMCRGVLEGAEGYVVLLDPDSVIRGGP
jgi:purine-binding chemotaxis protein CheW